MASNLIKIDEIHDAVRDHYAEQASTMLEGTSASSCCSSSCDCGYSTVDVQQLPSDVAQATWGCGDPVTLAALQPGQRVLDLGSGGGFDCILAAQRVGETGRVIGVDMTPQMLSLAWRNVAKMGFRNVEFRYGHIEQLPVESDTIDVILSNCVINLSPDKPAVFREAFRVLKPGGMLAVSDVVSDVQIPAEARADLVRLAECISGAIPEVEYVNQLRDAGFTDVKVVDRRFYSDESNQGFKTWSVRIEAHK